jgi:hypothetical protein
MREKNQRKTRETRSYHNLYHIIYIHRQRKKIERERERERERGTRVHEIWKHGGMGVVWISQCCCMLSHTQGEVDNFLLFSFSYVGN